MPYKVDDIVRIIAVNPASPMAAFLGSEARVLDKHETRPLYTIEVDVGRSTPDRGGQLGPCFVAPEVSLSPDVTEEMLRAGDEVLKQIRDEQPAMDAFGDEEMTRLYRAMRAARFNRR